MFADVIFLRAKFILDSFWAHSTLRLSLTTFFVRFVLSQDGGKVGHHHWSVPFLPIHSDSADSFCLSGAGPGGVQASYFLAKHQIPHLVLERSSHAGSFFTTYPVHRQLISLNKKWNYYPEHDFNMRHDWNSLLSDDMSLRMTDRSDDLFPNADLLRSYIQDVSLSLFLSLSHLLSNFFSLSLLVFSFMA